MGGLNPNIILSIGQNAQQQQPPNLLGQYQQIQQIQANKMAMQAQQQNMMLAGIKQQSAQVELGQQQLAAKQQQQAVEALSNAGGDVDKATAQLLAVGNPQGLTLQKHRQEVMKQMVDMQKTTADMQKTQAETQMNKLGHAASLMQGVLDAPPEMQGQVYQARRALALQAGFATPDQLPEVWNDQTKQQISGLQQQAISAKDQIQQKLEASKAVEQIRHNSAEEQLTQFRDINTAQNQGANLAETSRYHNIEAKQRGQQIAIEGTNAQTARASLGLRQAEFAQNYGAGGEGAGNSPLPGAMETIAQQVANGEKKLPRGMKGYNAISMRAQALNPNLGDQTYTTVQSYLSADGKESQKLSGITRVLGHIDEYQKNSQNLGFSPGLAAGMSTTGNAGLKQDATAITEEFGRLVKNGALTEGEAKHYESSLLSSRQGIRDVAIKDLKNLLGSQFETSFQNYTKATGQPLPVGKMFDADTQKRLAANYPQLTSGAAAGPAASPGVTAAPGVPSVGAMFNGEKVLKVTRVK